MRIAVTGIGVVSAIGMNCTETLQSLLDERSGIGAMRVLGSAHTELPVGEVPYTDSELRARCSIGDEPMPRTSLLGLLAAREALSMAGCTVDAFISGTTVGGMDLTEQHWLDYQQGKATENIRLHEAGESTQAILSHLQNDQMVNNQIVNVFTPSTACSSALNAIILGANLLRTGKAKSALVGGAESLSKFHLNGFNTLMILDQQPCHPFDANRNGLNLGEGAGYIVIEPEEEAIARRATILGYLSGYANTCDAFHQTASSADGKGAFLAMQGALQMAGLQPNDIDYVNAHGTATPNNDLSESAALTRLFGAQLPPVSSTKAFTGHTTSASGGIEAVICLLAMQQGFVPANLNWSQTAEGLIQPAAHTVRQSLHHVLCNSFGFGGNESSIVLSAVGTDLPIATFDSRTAVSCSFVMPEDAESGKFVSAAEARRMTPQMRRVVATVRQAMADTGINMPDAIVCATQWGCMLQSMRFLQDMIDSYEQQLKPTPFIQSTHNTVASLIAIMTGNHGYNATYSQGRQSVACATTDITAQLSLGLIRSALLIEFDEQVDAWDAVLCHIGDKTQNIAKVTVFTTK